MGLESLKQFLSTVPPGLISDEDGLLTVLVDCWNDLQGGDQESMEAYKLRGRMENVIWQPPILSFDIERHGRTGLGSTRADRHRWEIDIEKEVAHCYKIGHRQLRPMAPRLDVKPLARQVADLILAHKTHEWLEWNAEGSVWIIVDNIIPDRGFKQTVQGRRARFASQIDHLLKESGWQKLRSGVYAPAGLSLSKLQ